ncbi:MAG: hypothetical protein GX221_02025 [Candidatus Riflebacteria bacterium]|nr:hypothetical protein [Candidatus Riflebacteria bacterium]
MAKIKGKVQLGLGESKNTVKEQMPYFEECFPEISSCRHGTINVLLEKPLIVLSPDFVSAPLPWHPAFKIVRGGEIFKFLRIRLKIEGLEETQAWIYKAQFSPYQNNPYYIEILAPDLPFTGTPHCTITVPDNCEEGYIVIAKKDD